MSESKVVPRSSEEKTGEKPAIPEDRARAIAIQHALAIEEKKQLQTKVLDMILAAYDLPSNATADPAHPSPADIEAFRQCLNYFRPSDLDELVQERNIDERCGYALCSRPNRKELKARKIWDAMTGTLTDKQNDAKWCSKGCKDRNDFLRKQLSTEPIWLRPASKQDFHLLVDAASQSSLEATGSVVVKNEDVLALERGEPASNQLGIISILEKETTATPKPPRLSTNDILENLPLRTIGTSKTRKG